MTTTKLVAGAVALFLTASLAAPALAGGVSAAAPGKNKDFLISVAQSDPNVGSPTPGGVVTNLGGAISGEFFGNTSNSGANTEDAPARGHGVTPSISPGPQLVGGGFVTLGEVIQFYGGH